MTSAGHLCLVDVEIGLYMRTLSSGLLAPRTLLRTFVLVTKAVPDRG